uniref:Calcitonin receptor n=1 Tax=Panagrolaimus sp. ES5 TaxID=591445 RepID=A0AC34FN97_9BILA
MEQCMQALERSGLSPYGNPDDNSSWCNATWDTVLCWPSTRSNTSITLQCPPLKGLDPTKNITKFCHASGRWMGKTEDDFSRSHGWTNFTMCFTQEVVDIMKNLNNGSLGIAQDVAKNARKLEFIGLGLSLASLIFGVPLIHTCIWLIVILLKKRGKVERCLGSYYLEPEFWILDGPRMLQLVVNTLFICNVIRVLWSKVRESHNTSELDRMKKSVKAALMLIPLLGIPNIMQTIPFSPTQENIVVQAVIKSCYSRYRLRHTSSNELRRGSRSFASYYQVRNGNVTTSLDGNGNTKDIDETPNMKLLLPTTLSSCDCSSNRNNSSASESHFSYTSATENTPLRSCLKENEFELNGNK